MVLQIRREQLCFVTERHKRIELPGNTAIDMVL